MEGEPPIKRVFVSFEGSKAKTTINKLTPSALRRILEGQGVYKLYQECGDAPPVWQSVEDVKFKDDAHYVLSCL